MAEPKDLYKFVNKLVEVTTKSNNRCMQGIVVTIDPETKTMILLKKEDHSKIHIINGDMIKSKTIVDPTTSYEDVTQDYLKELYNRPNQIDALVRKTLSNNSKCTKLSALLRKNNYDAFVENGIIKISDQLILLPPYGTEQCISSDKTLLLAVKNLIANANPG
uniref:AD domain-containing protein n=2 Tax=Cacopsylla melanoneura TaxID=428564 RepID=A0A8D8Q5P6_9HEMI